MAGEGVDLDIDKHRDSHPFVIRSCFFFVYYGDAFGDGMQTPRLRVCGGAAGSRRGRPCAQPRHARPPTAGVDGVAAPAASSWPGVPP